MFRLIKKTQAYFCVKRSNDLDKQICAIYDVAPEKRAIPCISTNLRCFWRV